MREPIELRARFRGAFLGAALGDALGRPFEGASARELRDGGTIASRALRDEPWGYSDDTEMLLGAAESLLRCERVNPEDLLATLARNCEPARGYGHGTRRTFEAFERGASWQQASRATWPEGSRGNGAVVRAVPLACLYHHAPAQLLAAAEASAAVTHAHPIGRLGSAVFASALAHALHLEPHAPVAPAPFLARVTALLSPDERAFAPRLARIEGLLSHEASVDEAVRALGNGVPADESVPVALYAFAKAAPDFAAVVTLAASCGGDTDTIAAMSGALAGAVVGEGGLPPSWLARLENGPQGRDALAALADGVFALWQRRAG